MSSLTDEQKNAVESIGANMLVAAGAGSGKTHVLVERYIQILRAAPEAKVSELVAVTYTKKAANEMRNRLKLRMEEILATLDDVEERDRWRSLRVEVDGARIGTIHSLCESILRAFPAEAHIDPQFELFEELDAAERLSESVEEALLKAPEEHELLLRKYAVESVSEWVGNMVRSQLRLKESVDRLGDLTVESLDRHCQSLIADAHRRAVAAVFADPVWRADVPFVGQSRLKPDSKLEEVRAAFAGLAARASDAAGSDPASAAGRLRAIREEIRLPGGAVKDETAIAVKAAIKRVRDLLDEWITDLPDRPGVRDREAMADVISLIGVASEAMRIYERSKRNTQRLDFDDLIKATYDLLGQPGSPARRYYNDVLRAILVDEFQDTNRMQSELIAMLAGPATRLFLIGDDKQSIYKFQGADVSTFNGWERIFAGLAEPAFAISGQREVESLSTSFRSRPAIVNMVNAVFARLMDEGAEMAPYKARFRALTPSREEEGDSRCIEVVVLEALDDDGKPDGAAAGLLEADAVADWIREKVTGGLPVREKSGQVRPAHYGDFAVLVQRNDDLKPIEQALSAFAIPFVALGGAGFLERQEVFDMENMLRFLGCPEDSESLLGVLRSPMFGVSDDIIHGIKAGDRSSLWSRVRHAVRDGRSGSEALHRAVAVLSELLLIAGRRPLGELAEAVVRDTRYDIILASVPNGRQRSRNLWKVVALAYHNGRLSAVEFADRLARMRELKIKQSAAPLDSGNSVKLMTIHGSKGLEFPVVLLPVMGADASRDSKKLHFHREYGVALDTTRSKDDEKPALFRLARLLEKDMAAAEKKRLFYVAMTRARDHLAMFVNRRGNERVSFRSWLSSILGLDELAVGELPRVVAVGAGDERATCVVRFVDRGALGQAPGVLPAGGGAEDADLSPDLSSLAPAVWAESRPRWNWQELLRVTPHPGDGGGKLQATLVGVLFHALMERFSGDVAPLSLDTVRDVALADLKVVVHRQELTRLLSEGERLLAIFYESELCLLMRRARRRLHEVPYLLPGRDDGARRPDLLIEDEDGSWRVIDYKTDHFDPLAIKEQAEGHRAQLDGYAADIETLTGRLPLAGVYFAQHGILWWLDR